MDHHANDEVSSRVLNALRSIVRAIAASARTANSSGGISGAQLFALRQISDSPRISINELATRTLARQSSVSELATRLVERGLITRSTSADDARQVELALTAKGRLAIAESRATAQEKLISGFASLPKTTRAQIAEGLEKWLAASGLADVEPTMFFERGQASE